MDADPAESPLTAAFAALGEAVVSEGVSPVAAVVLRWRREPLLWLYLPPDSEPGLRLMYLEEVHRRLLALVDQVDQARRQSEPL